MIITFRSVNYDSASDCELLAKWHNNPVLQILVQPTRPGHPRRNATPAEIRKWSSEKGGFRAIHDLMILADEKEVGSFQIIIDPPHKRSIHKVAWPSVVIAESDYRRKGIGTVVARKIASFSLAAGATHIEAGVFEYNTAIRSFLTKYGFSEIGKVEKFTWHEGRAWADVRYEKSLLENPFQ